MSRRVNHKILHSRHEKNVQDFHTAKGFEQRPIELTDNIHLASGQAERSECDEAYRSKAVDEILKRIRERNSK